MRIVLGGLTALWLMPLAAAADLTGGGSLRWVAAADSLPADRARADIRLDGTNDTLAINAAVAELAAGRGGKLVFFPGRYVIDCWTEVGGRRYGIVVPHERGEVTFEGLGYTHKAANDSLALDGCGVVFALADSLYAEMAVDGRYALLGAAPPCEYSRGFFRVKDISFWVPGNEKALVALDGMFASESSIEGVQVASGAPFDDDSKVNPRCIAIRTSGAGNNGRRFNLDFCKVQGMGTAFHIEGEHLLVRQCAAQRCAYGYVFGDVDFLEHYPRWSGNHPITMVNCCFEYVWYGITLGGRQWGDKEYVNTLDIIDLNAEESEGMERYRAWKLRRPIQDLGDGYYRGEITYFFTAKGRDHVPSEFGLWGDRLAEGRYFRTINLAARRRGPTAERPRNVDLGFEYFDTDLGRMVYRLEGGWSE